MCFIPFHIRNLGIVHNFKHGFTFSEAFFMDLAYERPSASVRDLIELTAFGSGILNCFLLLNLRPSDPDLHLKKVQGSAYPDPDPKHCLRLT